MRLDLYKDASDLSALDAAECSKEHTLAVECLALWLPIHPYQKLNLLL